MSQIIKAISSGSLPPNVPTSFVTDSGTAIPAANILNVNGDNGIFVTGGTPAGNDVVVKFISGTGSTVDAATTNILTDTPPDNAATTYQILVDGYDSGNNVMVGGQLIVTTRKTAGTVTIVGTPDDVKNADAAVDSAIFTAVASGGNMVVQVTGVLGFTLAWKAIIAGKT